jgi:hypothetical protein
MNKSGKQIAGKVKRFFYCLKNMKRVTPQRLKGKILGTKVLRRFYCIKNKPKRKAAMAY